MSNESKSLQYSPFFFQGWCNNVYFLAPPHPAISRFQVLNGLVQTTGWPAVVACVGNWFGKGK